MEYTVLKILKNKCNLGEYDSFLKSTYNNHFKLFLSGAGGLCKKMICYFTIYEVLAHCDGAGIFMGTALE